MTTRAALLVVLLSALASGGCGSSDKLFFMVDGAVGERTLTARVYTGCDGGISDVDVDYEADAVVITFYGDQGRLGGDCGQDKELYEIDLDEELGARPICDGSKDPPVVVRGAESAHDTC